ncbi:MAG TPA: YdcF family protein, partial [Rhizobiaceae bacterium]|nr:YdcF family protein [Rhizobiaceae bacterium]
MFFILSKLFWIVFRPLNFLFFMALAGMLAGRLGWRRLRAALLAVSISAFVLFGFTQFTDLLLHRLESAVPAAEIPVQPAGIIVLGGGIGQMGSQYQLAEASDRLVTGLELKRLHPGARFIYSGGSGTLLVDQPAEAHSAALVVGALYGDNRGMELETRSRSTWENAVEVAAMLGADKARPQLLVTSAFHMPRAIGCFRRLGVNVIPVPTDFRADPLAFPWLIDETPNQFLKLSIFVKEL